MFIPKMKVIFVNNLLCLVLLKSVASGQNNLCSEEFCEQYLEQNECPSTTAACASSDPSLTGEIFPAAVPCNCCKTCLEHLKEGDFCTIGSPDTAPPSNVCGPGLYCTPLEDEKGYSCEKMSNTPCFKEQIDYDEKKERNETGSYVQRPKCDGDGNYSPLKCNIGQTCFCVNENGKRIFGEMIYSPVNILTANCECSRMHEKFSSFMNSPYSVSIARCLNNGSFDPLQCFNSTCTCVEQETGSPVQDIKYNMTEAEYESIFCFDRTIHRRSVYLHDCAAVALALTEEVIEAKKEGRNILLANYPKCQSDGWFASVQENETSYYCVDKYGKGLEAYSAPKSDASSAEITCNCARTEYLLRINKVETLPKCCPNGNFEKVQCRNDECYCVDENGLQINKEVPAADVKSLACYNGGNFC